MQDKINVEIDDLITLARLQGRNEQIGRMLKLLEIKPSTSELLDFVGQEIIDVQNLLDRKNNEK